MQTTEAGVVVVADTEKLIEDRRAADARRARERRAAGKATSPTTIAEALQKVDESRKVVDQRIGEVESLMKLARDAENELVAARRLHDEAKIAALRLMANA